MQDQVRKMSAVIYVESGKNTAICFIGLLNLCIFFYQSMYSRMYHEA